MRNKCWEDLFPIRGMIAEERKNSGPSWSFLLSRVLSKIFQCKGMPCMFKGIIPMDVEWWAPKPLKFMFLWNIIIFYFIQREKVSRVPSPMLKKSSPVEPEASPTRMEKSPIIRETSPQHREMGKPQVDNKIWDISILLIQWKIKVSLFYIKKKSKFM